MSSSIRPMSFRTAVIVLMDAAARDYKGQGCGINSTTDAHREKIATAWTVVFKRIYKRSPTSSEYFNAGIIPNVESL